MLSNTRYLTAIPTAAVMLCTYLGPVNLPERNNYLTKREDSIVATLGTKVATNMQWEDKGNLPYYQFVNDNERITSQINIIHGFVSLILQESQDLDPKYAKVVDRYFWDLV